MNIYVTLEEHRRLRYAAEMLGVSQSYVVRLILRDTLGLPTNEVAQAEIKRVKADMSKIGRGTAAVGQ